MPNRLPRALRCESQTSSRDVCATRGGINALGDFSLLRSSKVIKGLSAILSLLLATVAEQYTERLWVITMPSGLRELYHGPESYLSVLIVFIAVAVVVYKLSVRILMRGRSG